MHTTAKKSLGLALAAGWLCLTVQSADAQIRLAPELALAEDVDLGIGAHAFFPVGTSNFEIGAHFDHFFVSGPAGYSELGGAGYYAFRLPDNPSIVPKVGAGVTLGFVSLDREFKMTLVGFLRGSTYNVYSAPERLPS